MWQRYTQLEINGGRVLLQEETAKLTLPASPTPPSYMNAQIDDYAGKPRRHFPWLPGVELRLQARFSHPQEQLIGTAGFGFWNAPFGDPNVKMPALPQAVWFFFGSPPNDFPIAHQQPGRGFFAGTIDAGRRQALTIFPLALPVILLNQFASLRQRLFPWTQKRLGISYCPVNAQLNNWGSYRLRWRRSGCDFWLNDEKIFKTTQAPRGKLGFVCWMDNQYLAVTARGKINAGILPTRHQQWLEVKDVAIFESLEG